MLKKNDRITVHFINHWSYKVPTETRTRITGVVFEIKEKNGKLGFDGNPEKSPYTCRGDVFTPFSAYATSVIFQNVKTGDLYRFSNIQADIVKVNEEREKIKFL